MPTHTKSRLTCVKAPLASGVEAWVYVDTGGKTSADVSVDGGRSECTPWGCCIVRGRSDKFGRIPESIKIISGMWEGSGHDRDPNDWRNSRIARHFLAQGRSRRYDGAMIKLARRKFRAGAPDVCAANLPASVVPAEEEIFSI